MTPFVLFTGVASFFGFTVLTGDTLASAVAALMAGIAAWLTKRTNRNTEPSAPHEPDNLYDLVKKLFDEQRRVIDQGSPYQHQRNHDILNLQHRNGLYLWRIGKELGISEDEWPPPKPPKIDIGGLGPREDDGG